MRRLAAAACLVLAVAACTSDDDDDATSTTRSPSTATIPAGVPDPAGELTPLDEIDITLTEVARADEPTAFAVRAETRGFYIAERGGRVVHIESPGADPVEVVDISEKVSRGGEQGLLGIAFSADGRMLYTSYTNTDGDTRIDEHLMETGEVQSVFAVDQPYSNHNGGHIVFGPDGLLWLGLGDGGSSGDPQDRAQNPRELLGKLVRFDPAEPRPEIYALGLRNPWRFSFDRVSGDLWIGDVGQGAWEEIDHLPAATTSIPVNLGWNLLEGSHPFEAEEAPDTVLPVFEYSHDEGSSVVGGFVYRGTKHAGLQGVYVFTDTYEPRLWLLRLTDDGVDQHRTDVEVDGNVSSFGEDADGELYVLSLGGGIYRLDP